MRQEAEKVKIFAKQHSFCLPTLKKKTSHLFKYPINSSHRPSIDKFLAPLLPYHFESLNLAPEMSDILVQIQRALNLGVPPEVNTGGTCESYILRDENECPLAIFKPGLKRWAEEPLKEMAAYYLDYHGFAKVPPTVLTTLTSPYFKAQHKTRFGSCQLFVENSIVLMKVNKMCQESLSISELRRIAILDIRLINPDRHTSNVLVQTHMKGLRLVPIDHGSILPDIFFGACFFWLHYPEMTQKFNTEELAYIEGIDPLLEAYYLTEELNLSARSAQNMMVSTTMLKEGARRGLNLFQIGSLVMRQKKEVDGKSFYGPSPLEEVVKAVQEESYTSWSHFLSGVKENVIKKLEKECV